jgi:2-polyprenyl-3-methyl-5-hydroxy-6-metoxy-1,4-benzoquinol methylase
MCRAAMARDANSLTVAQDVSPEAVDACPWVDHYIQCEVGDERLARFAPYDVVSLTHVIEHLIDPVGVVAACARLMSPSGVLFITAPHRPRGWNEAAPDLHVWTAYSYNHVPAHVQYFSRDSMARLANAADCELVYWSDAHEGGEAFEAWLSPHRSRAPLSWIERTRMFVGRKASRLARLIVERQ